MTEGIRDSRECLNGTESHKPYYQPEMCHRRWLRRLRPRHRLLMQMTLCLTWYTLQTAPLFPINSITILRIQRHPPILLTISAILFILPLMIFTFLQSIPPESLCWSVPSYGIALNFPARCFQTIRFPSRYGFVKGSPLGYLFTLLKRMRHDHQLSLFWLFHKVSYNNKLLIILLM